MVVKEGGGRELKLHEYISEELPTVHAKTSPPRTEADSSFVPYRQNYQKG